MTEEGPTDPSTPLPFKLGLMEENCFTGSYFFKSPEGQQTLTTHPEEERSASPALAQDRPRAPHQASGEESYRDLLFTFPRLYSDLTLERDPFLESRGMPLNPHNTPITQSGRQSENGSWANDKRSVLTPVKLDNYTAYQSSDPAGFDDGPLSPLFNGSDSTWRPPKPPKPSFLSDVAISVQDDAENIRPPLAEKSLGKSEHGRPLPETPNRSLPLQATRKSSQLSERPTVGQPSNQRTVRPKQSWETRSIVPCRYFPRPFTRQELEILGIPLNNPAMPFPAPIPTIDNLPLRRRIINFDWKQADQYPQDGDSFPSASTGRPMATSGPSNAIWRFSQNAFALGKVMKEILWGVIPSRRRGIPNKQNPTVRTAITVPFVSRCETCSVEPEQVSTLGPVDGAYILQIDLAFPLLLIDRTALLANVIRACMSLKAIQITGSLARAFMEILFRWLLSVLKIDVVLELRRI